MNIYKKVGQKAKKAYQNWVSKQPYHIRREYEHSMLDNFGKDDCSNDSEDDWGERRSRLDENPEGREVSQNELIFMTGYLACQEEKEEEEREKKFTRQQTSFSSVDKPESSTTVEASKMLKEGGCMDEKVGDSAKTDGKTVVSFAPNLVSSTPKKDEDTRRDDPGTSQNRWQGEFSAFPEQTSQYVHKSPMMRINERQDRMQYEQEMDETRYGGGREMRHNPAPSWGSGWDPYPYGTQ